MIHIRQLLKVADAYLGALGLEDKTLSFRVFGDSKKLAALRNGADITTSRFAAAMLWFAANWPEGVAWPEGVERPEFAEAESAAPAEQAVA